MQLQVRTLPLFLFLFLMPTIAMAQMVIDIRKEITIAEPDSSYFLDFWIIDGSLAVRYDGEELQADEWTLDYRTGLWTLSPDAADFAGQTLIFQYRIIPVGVRPVYFNREIITRTDTTLADGEVDIIIRSRPTQTDIFGETTLNRSGSLSRGITVGTARDFSLESGLRFDLSGFITEEIEVLATLTDQSTPIQPDGSTQNLREFDQVFIRLSTPQHMLQMGDVDISMRNSEFAVIERRLQGVNVQTDFQTYGSYGSSAAVVRGSFRVQTFNGRDGIQGPYRLTGSNNEQFIIVLAGSERVYINGERVNRGEENEYIIDYGLGEIRFTNNQVITDDTRITVDFQYISDQYTRTLVTAEAQQADLMNGRLRVGASVIREADNINLSTQFQLTDEEIEILRNAGDQDAIVSGVDSIGFRPDSDFILYVRRDTLHEGQTYAIYENRPGDETGVFRVRFTRVEDGEGFYQRVGRKVNGIVYEWVGPGRGNYVPFRRINPPVEQTMVAINSAFDITDKLSVYGEWAGSVLDGNRLSAFDNQDNSDFAYLAGIKLNRQSTFAGFLSVDVRQRYTGRNFAFFDRTREVEFDRKWNISELDESKERITETDIRLDISHQSWIFYSGGVIGRNEFDGFRQEMRVNSREEGLPFLQNRFEYVQSDDEFRDITGNWIRNTGELGYDIESTFATITPRIGLEYEDREQRMISNEVFTTGTFKFYDIKPGLNIRFSPDLLVYTEFSYRKDQALAEQVLIDRSEAISQNYGFEYRRASVLQTENMFGLRNRAFEDFFITEQQAQSNRGVIIRSNTNLRPWDRFVDAQVLYEANTERRPILQETYIEVGPELGNFVWVDVNEDGIQQIDEFFSQQSPNEGIYLRQFIPSDELFPVIALRGRFRVRLEPARLMRNPRAGSLMRRLAGGLQSNTIIEIREDNRTQNLEDIYLLRLNKFRDDSLTIQGRLFWQQDVQLFRNNPQYDFRVITDRNLSQNRQASGLEKQDVFNLRVEPGYRYERRYIFSSEFRYGYNNNSSENLPSRNFQIETFEARPRVDIQFSRSVQTAAGFALIRREDRLPEIPTELRGFNIFSEARLYLPMGLQTNLRLERRSNDIRGESTSVGNFELTDGSGEGNTWNWNVQANYRISDFMRASLQYDGRTITDRPAVQTIRVVFSAVF